MTAIIAVKSKQGWAVHSDSLAMNMQYYEDSDIAVNIIDRIDKHRPKVFRVSSFVVVGFAGNAFPLNLLRPLANSIRDIAQKENFKKVTEIAEAAVDLLKHELKKGQTVQMMFVGYDLDNDGQSLTQCLIHVDNKYKIINITENYFALGAGQLISYTVQQQNKPIALFEKIASADIQADMLMNYLSDQEKRYIEVGENDWHIGGKVERIHITPLGVVNMPSIRKLPIQVTLGEVFDIKVKV